MPITVKHTKVSTIPDDADTSLVRPSDWNADHTLVGLGTMAEQNANNVNITGGTITGVSGFGDVIGPASSTDNAIARFDSTTGKLLQNSVVTVGDTGAVTGVTTLAASTSVTTPIVQATNSAGLALRNSAGTSQISMGAGGGDNVTIAVATNINGANAQIDISPTGTGHVHIKPTGSGSLEIAPTNAGTMNNMVIGGTTPLAGSFTNLSVTGTTSFDGSEGTAGQVLTSAGTGATPTWATPTTGTVTSVGATVPSVLSITGSPITTSGTLAIGYSGTALPIANGGTGATTAAEAFADLTPLTLTTASATPLVLTNTSGYQQQIVGGTNQTINLPSTATLAVGWSFLITNGTGFTVTVLTSTGASVYANSNIGSYRVWCVSTANNNATSWSAGAETFSFETGSGSVVRATTPTISSGTFTSPTATGALAFTGTTSQTAQFATNQTTANTTITTSQTSGTLTIGGTSGTGTQTIGQSTVSQTTNIQAGATASGSTKAMNIGTGGLAGSTTNIAIGSTTGTSTTTFNGITKNQTYTVANLPSASTSGVGASAFVTNALAPTFGATVAGGGAVAVPVYSDGTNWKVG